MTTEARGTRRRRNEERGRQPRGAGHDQEEQEEKEEEQQDDNNDNDDNNDDDDDDDSNDDSDDDSDDNDDSGGGGTFAGADLRFVVGAGGLEQCAEFECRVTQGGARPAGQAASDAAGRARGGKEARGGVDRYVNSMSGHQLIQNM